MKNNEFCSIEKKHHVRQSNSLIEARYKLNANEQKLIYLLCSKIHMDDQDFKPYRFKVLDISKYLGLKKNGSTYSSIYRLAKGLRKRDILIKTKEGNFLDIGWLSSTEHYIGQGMIEFSFDPKLKPYLLQLNSSYTSFKLGIVCNLNSFYSMRIFELCKQYLGFRPREFTIGELKSILMIKPNEYVEYKNFKARVLKDSINEINQNTNLRISLVEIKNGLKVIGVKFFIKSNENKKSLKTPMFLPLEASEPPTKEREDISHLSDDEFNSIGMNTISHSQSLKQMYSTKSNDQERRNFLEPHVRAYYKSNKNQ